MRKTTTLCTFLLGLAVVGCGGSDPGTPTDGPHCGDGICQASESESICCTDCGCPSGQTCSGGACVKPSQGAVCGNGKCESGESTTCCGDCGCPSGSTCGASGQCVAPTCTLTNGSCTYENDCCNYKMGTGHCIDFGSGGERADSCRQNSDCASRCCQTSDAGSQICAPANFCINLALGAPCTLNSECSSNLCVNGGSGQGWCSRACSTSLDCPNSPEMWCAANSSNADICWKVCTSNADCAAYGPAASCQSVTTVGGTVKKMCVG